MTHKERAEGFQGRTSYRPQREIYPRDFDKPRPEPMPYEPGWAEVGPFNSGGRLTSMAVHPHQPDLVFAGSAGGGVWRSEDAGLNWVQAWGNHMPTQIIGSLTISPEEPDALYCGTGEANLSADHYPGLGLFVSRDKGETWQIVRGSGPQPERFFTDTHAFVGNSDPGNRPTGTIFSVGLPRRIGAIAVLRVNGQEKSLIFAGGLSHDERDVAGLFVNKRGFLWQAAADENRRSQTGVGNTHFISHLNYFCHSVVVHRGSTGTVVYAAVEARGKQSGIWMSLDNGQSWEHANMAGVSGERFGRISMAVCPKDGVVWALAGQQGTQAFLGVFRSKNQGKSWKQFHLSALERDGQLSYTNCIAVHPENSAIAIAGSLNLHRTTNGGKTWKRISDWEQQEGELFVHEDQHAIHIGADNRVYSANDGGFSYSKDLGSHWEQRNKGLAVSMFYGLDVAPFDERRISGGCQDIGVWFQGPLDEDDLRQDVAELEFRQIATGDGGWTCYDPHNRDNPFYSLTRLRVFRYIGDREWDEVATEIPDSDRRLSAQTVITMTYGRSSGNPGVYMGSFRLWESLNHGKAWHALSNVFDGSSITAIEVPVKNGNVIYVGTANGGFFRGNRVRKGSRKWNWSRNLAGPISPGRTITRIATNPQDAKHVLYSIGAVAELEQTTNFSAERSVLSRSAAIQRIVGNEAKEHGGIVESVAFDHVYESRDGADTWDHTGGELPNVPHNAVLMDASGELLFAAHDMGVSVRYRGKWHQMNRNLPLLRITDLSRHDHSEQLFLSTYGRGIWKISLRELRRWLDDPATFPPTP